MNLAPCVVMCLCAPCISSPQRNATEKANNDILPFVCGMVAFSFFFLQLEACLSIFLSWTSEGLELQWLGEREAILSILFFFHWPFRWFVRSSVYWCVHVTPAVVVILQIILQPDYGSGWLPPRVIFACSANIHQSHFRDAFDSKATIALTLYSSQANGGSSIVHFLLAICLLLFIIHFFQGLDKWAL